MRIVIICMKRTVNRIYFTFFPEMLEMGIYAFSISIAGIFAFILTTFLAGKNSEEAIFYGGYSSQGFDVTEFERQCQLFLIGKTDAKSLAFNAADNLEFQKKQLTKLFTLLNIQAPRSYTVLSGKEHYTWSVNLNTKLISLCCDSVPAGLTEFLHCLRSMTIPFHEFWHLFQDPGIDIVFAEWTASAANLLFAQEMGISSVMINALDKYCSELPVSNRWKTLCDKFIHEPGNLSTDERTRLLEAISKVKYRNVNSYAKNKLAIVGYNWFRRESLDSRIKIANNFIKTFGSGNFTESKGALTKKNA